jgi:hypothetical protein
MTQMRWGGYNAGGHACIVAPAIWPRLLQRHKTAGMCNAEPIQARKIWFFQAPRLAMLLPLYALVVLIWGSTWIALKMQLGSARRAVHRLPLWSCLLVLLPGCC